MISKQIVKTLVPKRPLSPYIYFSQEVMHPIPNVLETKDLEAGMASQEHQINNASCQLAVAKDE